MDIFELAAQCTKIQQEEIILQQEIDEKENKKYVVDIKEAIDAASRKDYGWYHRLGEEQQKAFQPFIMNMWMGMIWTKNSSRGFKGRDEMYASTIRNVNRRVNMDFFNKPKGLVWLCACAVQEFAKYEEDKQGKRVLVDRLPFDFAWISSEKKGVASTKYDKRVISYMANELFSSTKKILELIDDGLITKEDMQAIAKDLDTLEHKK